MRNGRVGARPSSFACHEVSVITCSSTYLDMSSGDLPDRERSARPVWLCKAENLNFFSVSTSKKRFTKPLHILQTPSYSKTGRVSFSNTLFAMPGSFAASSTSSRAGDCAMRGCLLDRGHACALLRTAKDVVKLSPTVHSTAIVASKGNNDPCKTRRVCR